MTVNQALLDHQGLADVPTPALVIDRTALAANIARMAQDAAAAGVAMRPHAKTHKSTDIAALQRQAGAIGISCATLLEAEALAAAGIDGLLVTSPVVGPERAARLAALRRRTDVMAVVDHAAQVEAIAAVLPAGGPALGLLVDIDVGQFRTGVTSVADVIALARLIAQSAGLRFAGLQGYAGHIQHIVDPAERRQQATQCAGVIRAAIGALRAESLAPDIVTGGGTGASEFDLAGRTYTEVQVGSYVFMDAEYGTLRRPDGGRLPYGNALFVLATVVSANRPGQVTVDAGTKAIAVNGPMPDVMIGVPAGSTYRFAGDEHGVITLPAGAAPPAIGSRVLIGPTHCDPTVNLHAQYHVVSHNAGIDVWPIAGRYGAAPP